MLVMTGLVLFMGVLLGAAHAWHLNEQITATTHEKSLTLARAIASDARVRDEVSRISARGVPASETLKSGPLQRTASDAEERTGALFVVITDKSGIRLSHPDASRLGRMVSTDPSQALAGREVTTGNTGTLGPSAGAKVPIRGADGAVVGEVSVGFESQPLAAQWLHDARYGVLITAVATLAGLAAAAAFARRLHRDILGLEPEDIAAMATEQEAVLHGVDEGVVGLDGDLMVRLANASAQTLLPGLRLDVPAAEAGLPPELAEMLRGVRDGRTAQGEARTVVAGERVLVCTARRVSRHGTDLGLVVVLRDRTHVQAVSRELADARALTSALRVQRHEFSNQLHAIAGLVDSGAAREAAEYVRSLTRAHRLGSGLPGLERIGDDSLRSFLSAKAAQAHERSVAVLVSESSDAPSALALPEGLQDVTTVLGNLLDNAVSAAVAGGGPSPAVLADLVEHDGALHLAVTDTGPGIDEPERVFESGYSGLPTARDESGGHGIGLPLVRQIARARGGEVWIGAARGTVGAAGAAKPEETVGPAGAAASPEARAWPGATMCARLPGVLAEAGGAEADEAETDESEEKR